jgi:5-(aminomethyl)-3-furanmethanol phosphate kinase
MKPMAAMDLVVKVGGGLLADYPDFANTLEAIAAAAATLRIVVIPGGGVFADAVRLIDRQLTLSANAAHWMAILAMDQYAHVIASRLPMATLVESREAALEALTNGEIPVLAPSRWLKQADPLPHSWDVTSDSLAAWLAGELGATQLVLMKPAEASEPLLDPYFTRALPPHVTATVVRAGAPLHTVLAGC